MNKHYISHLFVNISKFKIYRVTTRGGIGDTTDLQFAVPHVGYWVN